MPKVYLREEKRTIQEKQFGSRGLHFLYNTRMGRFLLHRYFLKEAFSEKNQRKMMQSSSLSKIKEVIEQYDVDMTEYENQKYENFREFFLRELPASIRPVAKAPALVTPADSRLIVYNGDGRSFKVKGLHYTLEMLLQDATIASQFQDAWILIYRLAMGDNHHYIEIADGKNLMHKEIPGHLHTVSHFSKEYPIYGENKRVWTLQELEGNLKMINMEVGAMLVGAIHNEEHHTFTRGQKKGFFDLGGSTIIHIIPKHRVRIDSDILEQSDRGVECLVKRGERVGTIL